MNRVLKRCPILLLIISLFIEIACSHSSQIMPTSQQDPGDASDRAKSLARLLRFTEARKILVARCVTCHLDKHASWKDYSESDYIDNHLVVEGRPWNSPLFTELAGVQGEMPQGESPLDVNQRDLLQSWIAQMDSSPPAKTAEQLYGQVKIILKQKCMTCHSTPEQGWPDLDLLDNSDWVRSEKVIPAHPENSPLFLRLRENGLSETGDMPAKGPPLSPKEIDTLRQWIMTLPQPE